MSCFILEKHPSCLEINCSFDENFVLFSRPSRFKQYSVVEQQQDTDHHENDTNLAFTIPREFITRQDLTSGSLFHGRNLFQTTKHIPQCSS